MTKRIRRSNSDKTRHIDDRLIGSAYSYYGGVVRTSGEAKTPHGLKRVFAAALLSGASVLAVGFAGTGAAKAGSCNTIGTQVICTGAFDESVQYTGVEDLTVTLGAGSVIDTTDETSENDFDNAGILVTGDGNVAVVNNGSILTGDNLSYNEEVSYFGGYRHHGIAAYSDDGNASVQNSAQGTIVTTSNYSHGAVAAAGFEGYWGGNASAVNHGLIGTEGSESFGLAAIAKYTASATNSETGAIFTDGEGSIGIYAYSKYESIVVNNGSIETWGEYADGIVAVSGGSVTVTNNGSIETAGESASGIVAAIDWVLGEYSESSTVTVANSGSIDTEGDYADGIRVYAADGSATITNSGSITTDGDEAHGISAEGYSVSVVNDADGVIETYGDDSYGVDLWGHSVSLDNAGNIVTWGEDSHAVVAHSNGDLTTTISNSGFIGAYGDEADAIRASGPTVRVTNTEDGEIYSADRAAIRIAESDDARVYNYGSIHGNVKMQVEEYGYVLNDGTIVSDRRWVPAVGIEVYDGDAVVVNNGSISTTARNASGIEVSAGDFAEVINNGSITTGGDEGWSSGHKSHGIDAYGENGVLVVNTGDITTHGERAYAIRAVTDGDEAAQAISSGTIVTHGNGSIGIAAEARGDFWHNEEVTFYYGGDAIAGNVGSVTTYGEDAIGVIAVSKYEDAIAYNMLDGTITTSGDGAHGLVAASGFSLDEFLEVGHLGHGSEYSGNAAAINGLPLYGGGMFFFGGYGEWDAHASIFDHVDFGEGVSFPEDVDLTAFRPSIVTTGDNAIGVLAVSSGSYAFAANFNGDVTTGTFDEYGPVGGYRSYGVAAFAKDGTAIAMNMFYGSITTFGERAHGVIAKTRDGAALTTNKYSSSIVTHGDRAHGLYASSSGETGEYGNIGIAFNRGSTITTYGQGSHGIYAYSEMGVAVAVNANIDDEGEIIVARIETHGDDAHGIYVYSHDSDVQAYNSGEIVTHGADAIGIKAGADNDATVENSGTITTHGDHAYGIHAYAWGNIEIDNSGDIVTGGHEADGIVAYARGEYGDVNIVNSGLIHAQGESSDAIIASGAYVTITNTADGEIFADDNDGIEVNDSGTVRIYNFGAISGSESAIEIDESDDVAVYNYGSIIGRIDIEEAGSAYFFNDEDATVLVENKKTAGVRLLAFEDATVVNRGSIRTTADNTRGVQLRGNTVSLYNSGTVLTSGDNAHAVVAHSNLPATTTITNSGTIEATGKYADAIQASGPSVFITNTEDGSISSANGDAIHVYDSKYVSIVNHGDIYGDVVVAGFTYHAEYAPEVYVLHTGYIDGNIITVEAGSDDTIIVDGGRITGAIFTGDGTDEVTVQGEGVELGKGIHAGGEGTAHLTFAHDDEIVLDDGIEGWAISGFDLVDFDSGRVELDGFGIHTAGEDGTVNVAEGAVLATTGEGAHVAAAEVNIGGTLDIGLGGFFDVTGDVSFGGDSLFFTRIQNTTAGVVSGNTVTFAEGSTIFADVTGGLEASVGEDILIASAGQENGVTDHGALVEDNIFLFYFSKVMNGDIIDTGSADQLFLRVQIEETAFDTADDAKYTKNQLNIAKALDVYLRTQPLSSPLVKWLSQFETEEEQREELLKVIKDTLPEESTGSGTATITSTDLIYDMIMDRLSGGGFVVAHSGQTGVAAGDAALGGDGKWAIWGRAGASTASFTPGGVNGFDADSWGITVGVDGELSTNFRAGLGAFYLASDVEENGAGANATNDITGYGMTAYFSYRPNAWYMNGAFGFGTNEYDSQRRSIGGVNIANYDGTQFVARAEVGHMFTSGQWDITPNVGLRYNRVDIDGYTETGPLPISVDGQTVESLRAVAGVNARYSFLLEDGGKLIPEFGVKVLGELADPDQAITGSVVGGGAFSVQSVPRDDVSFGLGAGITWEVSDRFSLRVTYDGELQSDYDEHALAAAVRFAF